jgi:hypothetical protein
MSEQVAKAREALRSLLHEFEPTKGHFVAGTREFLLALRSAVDAQIVLLDRAVAKKPPKTDDPNAPKVVE